MYYRRSTRGTDRHLDQILGFGVLTPKQEVEAFRALNLARDKLRRILRLCGYTPKEAREASVGLENGSFNFDRLTEGGQGRLVRKRRSEIRRSVMDLLEARAFIVERNLRLVASIAHQFTGRGIELEDLIGDGNLGLLKAVERFDASRGFKFSTYATWWIRQTVSRSLENFSRFIRLPVNVKATLDRIHRETERLTKVYKRLPSAEEIGANIDVPPEKVRKLQRFGDRDAISLDAPMREGGEAHLSDLIPSLRFELPPERAEEVFRAQELHQAMKDLTSTEKYVIEARFGLSGVRHQTLKEIGSQFSLSRERIRQIEAKALGKLQELLLETDPESN